MNLTYHNVNTVAYGVGGLERCSRVGKITDTVFKIVEHGRAMCDQLFVMRLYNPDEIWSKLLPEGDRTVIIRTDKDVHTVIIDSNITYQEFRQSMEYIITPYDISKTGYIMDYEAVDNREFAGLSLFKYARQRFADGMERPVLWIDLTKRWRNNEFCIHNKADAEEMYGKIKSYIKDDTKMFIDVEVNGTPIVFERALFNVKQIAVDKILYPFIISYLERVAGMTYDISSAIDWITGFPCDDFYIHRYSTELQGTALGMNCFQKGNTMSKYQKCKKDTFDWGEVCYGE